MFRIKKMDVNDLDIEKFKKKNSSRHHYIPQFLIEGFTNADGVTYVYDKKRDKILNKPKAPKAIFFERDRNTVNLPDNKQSSILEDILFQKIDNIGSEIVKYFQNTELSKVEFNYDNSAHFLFFLVTLFWRIPLTDFATIELANQTDIQSKDISSISLKNDDNSKLQTSGLILHTLNEMKNSSSSSKKWINLHQMSEEMLVLGDNPLLNRKTSDKFSEFGKGDFLIALTSRRIYSSTKDNLGGLPVFNAVKYNTAVINQSLRYVCCGNLDFLKKSVKTYKEFRKLGLNYNFNERTFEIKKD